MKWAVITLTKGAAKLGKIIAEGMLRRGSGTFYISERFIDEYSIDEYSSNGNVDKSIDFSMGKLEIKDLKSDELEVDNNSFIENKYAIAPVKKPFKDFVGELFYEYDALIFVMATGIVCRSIAPYIQSKTKDPAIIVCDEAGRHAISLLSGHLGGGNELSEYVAGIYGGEPVITTASDVTGSIAVDMLAKSIGAKISSMEKAKDVTAIAVDNKKICILIDENTYNNPFYGNKLDKIKSDKVIIKVKYKKRNRNDGVLNNVFDKTYSTQNLGYKINNLSVNDDILSDNDVKNANKNSDGVIIISENKIFPTSTSVQLIPQILHLGIGCKKDTPFDVILNVFDEACDLAKIDKRAISSVATIELKSKEKGILALCDILNLELKIVGLDDIRKIQHCYKGSDFVEKTIGVRAVSEPCAQISGNKNGYMRIGRYAKDGVTISLWEDL